MLKLSYARATPSRADRFSGEAVIREAGSAKAGVREIVNRRPKYYKRFQEDKTLKLPGF